MTNLIFKIVSATEWEDAGEFYQGSAHDKEDGFLHFSTQAQLPETMTRHYAGLTDLVVVAVDADKLGAALKWEHAPSRNADFPHLYGALPKSAVVWVHAVADTTDARLFLPHDFA